MQSLLEQAAISFQIEPTALKKLTGGNFSQVYGFERGGHAYILRITPPDPDIDQPAMESILHWMQYLATHGVPVPKPFATKNGALVETVLSEEDTYLISAVENAPGVLAETIPFDGWNERLFEQLGRLTGKMHALSSDYSPPVQIRPRPQWDQAANGYHPEEKLDPKDLILLERQMEIMNSVQKLPRTPDGYGLIHGDLHGANFFVDQENDHITLFDFDDCCYGWYAMDIALPLLDFLVLYPGIEREHFAAHFLTCFLKGYLHEHTLEQYWLSTLPDMLTLLEIGLYAQVYSFADSVSPTSWVGKFMLGRRESIAQQQPFVSLDMAEILHSRY